MKYLITGISGFVGGHLVELLFKKHGVLEIVGIDIIKPNFYWMNKSFKGKIKFINASLLDTAALENIIKITEPDYIIHLASLSSVADSWKNPVKSFINNTNIFLNLVETIRRNSLSTKILSVGSSEEYGIVSPEDTPLCEEIHINPMNPYAVARVSQEYLSKIYSKGYGLAIVCTRSFNHVGPRQSEMYVVSSFVKQAVEVKLNKREKISCGNLSVIRDFIDVRDVVKGYELLLDKGVNGEIYNVCSGHAYLLSDVLQMICKKVNINFLHSTDQNLFRPIDNPIIVGSNKKITELGLKLDYSLDRSLDNMIEYWSGQLGKHY